jgi:acyl carrier protein
MEIQDFIQNVADQFDDTDTSTFTPETIFKDVEEWSSLTALSVIAMVDEEYEVRLKGDDITNTSTIQDLFNLIKSKM